ncbi:MAG: YccF domain-containing protein [Prolixibacteraceae bacterium]
MLLLRNITQRKKEEPQSSTEKDSVLRLCGSSKFLFGKTVRSTGGSIPGLSCLLNLIWLIFAGIWIALSHLIFGAFLCITIIGIPFGLQHFKLMRLSLYPFGFDLV